MVRIFTEYRCTQQVHPTLEMYFDRASLKLWLVCTCTHLHVIFDTVSGDVFLNNSYNQTGTSL